MVLTVALQEIGKARFFFGVADDKRLLRLPDPAGGVALNGRLAASDLFAGDASFKNVETHDVAGRLVKYEREKIEFDNGMETAGEVVEQRGEIALLGDGLTYFEQGFELTPGMFKRGGEHCFRREDDGFRHRRQDNIWAGAGSTCGERELDGILRAELRVAISVLGQSFSRYPHFPMGAFCQGGGDKGSGDPDTPVLKLNFGTNDVAPLALYPCLVWGILLHSTLTDVTRALGRSLLRTSK